MPAASITSVRSDRVTAVRKLQSRSGRRKAGHFLAEGPQVVLAAFASGYEVVEVFVDVDAGADIHRMVEKSPVRVTWVTSDVLKAMGETDSPQGVLAVCGVPQTMALADAMANSGPVVILDKVSDPGNVGTMIRTAHAAGAACLVLTSESADVFSGKVVRATAGSIFSLPVIAEVSIDEIAEAAAKAERAIVVTTGTGEVDLFEAVASRMVCPRTCWVIGSEAHGISAGALAAADLAVRVPMMPGPESLNAATALAIVLYVTAFERGVFQSPIPESRAAEIDPSPTR